MSLPSLSEITQYGVSTINTVTNFASQYIRPDEQQPPIPYDYYHNQVHDAILNPMAYRSHIVPNISPDGTNTILSLPSPTNLLAGDRILEAKNTASICSYPPISPNTTIDYNSSSSYQPSFPSTRVPLGQPTGLTLTPSSYSISKTHPSMPYSYIHNVDFDNNPLTRSDILPPSHSLPALSTRINRVIFVSPTQPCNPVEDDLSPSLRLKIIGNQLVPELPIVTDSIASVVSSATSTITTAATTSSSDPLNIPVNTLSHLHSNLPTHIPLPTIQSRPAKHPVVMQISAGANIEDGPSVQIGMISKSHTLLHLSATGFLDKDDYSHRQSQKHIKMQTRVPTQIQTQAQAQLEHMNQANTNTIAATTLTPTLGPISSSTNTHTNNSQLSDSNSGSNSSSGSRLSRQASFPKVSLDLAAETAALDGIVADNFIIGARVYDANERGVRLAALQLQTTVGTSHVSFTAQTRPSFMTATPTTTQTGFRPSSTLNNKNNKTTSTTTSSNKKIINNSTTPASSTGSGQSRSRTNRFSSPPIYSVPPSGVNILGAGLGAEKSSRISGEMLSSGALSLQSSPLALHSIERAALDAPVYHLSVSTPTTILGRNVSIGARYSRVFAHSLESEKRDRFNQSSMKTSHPQSHSAGFENNTSPYSSNNTSFNNDGQRQSIHDDIMTDRNHISDSTTDNATLIKSPYIYNQMYGTSKAFSSLSSSFNIGFCLVNSSNHHHQSKQSQQSQDDLNSFTSSVTSAAAAATASAKDILTNESSNSSSFFVPISQLSNLTHQNSMTSVELSDWGKHLTIGHVAIFSNTTPITSWCDPRHAPASLTLAGKATISTAAFLSRYNTLYTLERNYATLQQERMNNKINRQNDTIQQQQQQQQMIQQQQQQQHGSVHTQDFMTPVKQNRNKTYQMEKETVNTLPNPTTHQQIGQQVGQIDQGGQIGQGALRRQRQLEDVKKRQHLAQQSAQQRTNMSHPQHPQSSLNIQRYPDGLSLETEQGSSLDESFVTHINSPNPIKNTIPSSTTTSSTSASATATASTSSTSTSNHSTSTTFQKAVELFSADYMTPKYMIPNPFRREFYTSLWRTMYSLSSQMAHFEASAIYDVSPKTKLVTTFNSLFQLGFQARIRSDCHDAPLTRNSTYTSPRGHTNMQKSFGDISTAYGRIPSNSHILTRSFQADDIASASTLTLKMNFDLGSSQKNYIPKFGVSFDIGDV